MTKVDTKTGVLEFLGYIITPKTKVETLSSIFNGYAKPLKSHGVDYDTFRIDLPVHENLYVIYFFKGLLKSIEIYSKADGYSGGKGNNRILEELGGEGVYPWGAVELYHNNQAGFSSVRIKYSHT